MIDTMTATKVVGGFCGTLLVFLLGAWAAEAIYHVGTDDHGEGHEQAYVIDTGAAEGGEEEAVEVAFADVYAEADASAGGRIWRQCAGCHKLEDGVNAVGPHLHDVVGRQIATVDDYGYSATLAEMGDELAWTPENLEGFLANPSEWAPGTKMTYSGLKSVEDRANIIAYLAVNGGV
jgi:cytochrome c